MIMLDPHRNGDAGNSWLTVIRVIACINVAAVLGLLVWIAVS
jgi:hypothetical protein